MIDYEKKLIEYQKYIPLILRVSLGLVFFVFGIDKFIRPEYWVGWMPEWMISMISFNINYFMYFQGVVETIVGVFLIIGLFTRISSFISGGILFLIVINFIFNPTTISHFSQLHIDKDIFPLLLNEIMLRDLGLLAIAISLFLLGGGKGSIDNYINKIRKKHPVY